MVKNTTGGSKAKGFARKHANNSDKTNNNLRTADEEGEIYAIVTKMCGGSMFQCYCMDDVERLCHIRGSFSGRKKRDNIVTNGGWVLIGIREWDKKSDVNSGSVSIPMSVPVSGKKVKLPQCDLLEVYTDRDKISLRETVKTDWKILLRHDPTKFGNDDEDIYDDEDDEKKGFKFSTDKDIERDKLLQEANSATAEKIKLTSESETLTEEDWISYEDV